MTKTLEMVFRNSSGKEVTLSLADPKEDLTKLQVDAVMQEIISRNIFTSKTGELIQSVEAASVPVMQSHLSNSRR